MSFKQLFLNRIAKIKHKGYTPKFKKGDVIYNSKFRIFRKIIDIDYMSAADESGRSAQYICLDLKNDLTKYMDCKKIKEAIKIDDYYELADEKMVSILFGQVK